MAQMSANEREWQTKCALKILLLWIDRRSQLECRAAITSIGGQHSRNICIYLCAVRSVCLFALTLGQFRFFQFLLAGKGNVWSGEVCEEFKSIAFTYWWQVNFTFNSPLNHNIRSPPLNNACKLVPRVYSAQNLPKIDRWRDSRLSNRIYMMARKWKNCVDFFPCYIFLRRIFHILRFS